MGTARNLIDVFAKGNQELFHSAFLAWLLTSGEAHGLEKTFRSTLLTLLGTKDHDPDGNYEVKTEFGSGRSRFDIFLRPVESKPDFRGNGIVIENKIKSFGYHLQLDKYRSGGAGYEIAILALLPQTLDEETKERYPVITYNVIHSILDKLDLSLTNPYHFLIDQYRVFLKRTLSCYSTIADYSNGVIGADIFFDRLTCAVEGVDFRDNDIRTFDYFYYHMLREFIKTSAKDLAFGECKSYKDAEQRKENTIWFLDKNMQGPPFMEAIINSPFGPGCWALHDIFKPIYDQTSSLQIAPRLEIRLDPVGISKGRNVDQPIGTVMLGTWNTDFRAAVKTQEPYRTRLRGAGQRNFHYETVCVRDLPFANMAERIRNMMSLVFDTRKIPNVST